jgi:hypothetical protein
MYVLKHVRGMDYLAKCAGREFATDSDISLALKFDTRGDAEEAERITPGMWTVEEISAPLVGNHI